MFGVCETLDEWLLITEGYELRTAGQMNKDITLYSYLKTSVNIALEEKRDRDAKTNTKKS